MYTREKEVLIKREFLVLVLHPKGGNIVWTCVKDNTTEEEEGGGVQEGLDGYPYLMHITKLWPEDWVKQTAKTNQVVGEKNRLDTSVGRKRLVHPFTRNEFWKYIGRIISAVKFRVKRYWLWGKPEASVSKKG